jgi:hypothetical protein
MADLITIDRGAFMDLIQAVTELTNMLSKGYKQPYTVSELEEENLKLKYINKLILTSMESYKKHNP